jgi:hypothetical protein
MGNMGWAEYALGQHLAQEAADEAAADAHNKAMTDRVADLMDDIACSDLDAKTRGTQFCGGQPVDDIGAWMCGPDDGDSESPERLMRQAMRAAAVAFSKAGGRITGGDMYDAAGQYLAAAMQAACYARAEEEASK